MKTPRQIIKAIIQNVNNCCPDEIYLNSKFKKIFGRNINWKNPTTFNEKLQWLKVYDRNPLYTQLVDKYEVRKYIAEKIGEQYLIPCLGVWDKFDDIDFDKLPQKFVLKCTHDSHSVVICKDKSTFDIEAAGKSLNEHLGKNFYYNAREWPYKNVKPRIIAEKYMSNDADECDGLTDYKVMCFSGIPKLIQIHIGRFAEHTQDFYDTDWNKTDIQNTDTPMSDESVPKPEFLNKMLELSSVLSKNIAQVRVDWYISYGKMYFGEMTFFDGAGFTPFERDGDERLGSYITLPEKNN